MSSTSIGNKWLVALVATLLASAGPTAADTLRIGNEGDYKPFAFQGSDGSLQGFDIDIAREICTRLDRECDIVVQEFKGLIPALKANRFDLIVSSMTINDERRQQVLFSKPYYQAPYTFLAREGTTFEISESGLKGLKIGVVANGAQRRWLEDNYGGVIDLKLYDAPADIRADMLSGRLDATVGTMPYLHGAYIQEDIGAKFAFIGEPLRSSEYFGEGVGICARLGEQELIDQVNMVIDEIYADGTFKKINDKYFPFYIGNSMD